jgi:hypothetical protein
MKNKSGVVTQNSYRTTPLDLRNNQTSSSSCLPTVVENTQDPDQSIVNQTQFFEAAESGDANTVVLALAQDNIDINAIDQSLSIQRTALIGDSID